MGVHRVLLSTRDWAFRGPQLRAGEAGRVRDGAVGAGSIALLSVSQTAGPQLSPGTLVVDLGTLLLGARPQGGPLQLTLMAGSDQPS